MVLFIFVNEFTKLVVIINPQDVEKSSVMGSAPKQKGQCPLKPRVFLCP